MLRSGNNLIQPSASSTNPLASTRKDIRHKVRNWEVGSGRWRFQSAFHCDLDQPLGWQDAVSPAACSRSADELSALLDRALAFAG